MKRTKDHRGIGDVQLRILKELWGRGAASVTEVHQTLASERTVAYTTIATMLRKMEERGLVRHREEGRAFIYRAAVKMDEVNQGVTQHFLQRLFAGSVASAVGHLLQSREVSRAELEQLEKLIAEAKRRAK
jgi:predicted transcriptional regulator